MQAKNNFQTEVGECLLPNIPWYSHDGVVLTQHSSILRRIAQVHMPSYLGSTPQDQAKIEMALAVTEQLNMKCLELCYARPEPSDEVRAAAITKFQKELEALDKECAGKTFFMGDQLSIYDFYHFDMWERAKVVSAQTCAPYTNLEKIQNNFEAQA